MRRLLAIAANTVSQGIRMRVPLLVIAFLLVVIPILPLLLESDGSAKGQIQLILTYSLNVASFLLSLLAVFLSVAILTNDIAEKQIYVLDSTPVRRWEMIAGKWLGIMLLCSILLTFIGGSIYGMIRLIVEPKDAHEAEVLQEEVYTARAVVKPQPVDVAAESRLYFEKFKKEGMIPPETTEKQALTQLKYFVETYSMTVLSRSPRTWKFKDLPPPHGEDEILTVRYKVRAGQKPADGTVRCRWEFFNDSSEQSYIIGTKEQVGSIHEFRVPASVVGMDGSLSIRFLCADDTSIIFDKENGLEILYKAGGFEANFVKCLVFILINVGFLTAAGLTAGTFLTFPVASLAGLFVLLIAAISGSIGTLMGIEGPGAFYHTMMTTLSLEQANMPPGWEPDMLFGPFKTLWSFVIMIVPDFGRHSGISRITLGEIISGWELARSAATVSLLRGGLLMCLGIFILNRRELAEIEE